MGGEKSFSLLWFREYGFFWLWKTRLYLVILYTISEAIAIIQRKGYREVMFGDQPIHYNSTDSVRVGRGFYGKIVWICVGLNAQILYYIHKFSACGDNYFHWYLASVIK